LSSNRGDALVEAQEALWHEPNSKQPISQPRTRKVTAFMTDFAAARTAMVDTQVRPSDVTSLPIIEAMLWAPRELFAPKSKRDIAYVGEHVDLGNGRAMLDPRVFAKMIDAAKIGPDDLVMDVGCGMGYSTAVISRLAAAVVAVEEHAQMVEQASATLSNLSADNAMVQQGDLAAGDPDDGPFDVIFINGAIQSEPQALLAQLKDGGRLVAIWMDGPLGQCRVWLKTGEAVAARRVFDATAPVLDAFAAQPAFTF
jgi:protein-L-isoaspartate(D-aspartate) O-methyltransferase